jgi:drug/metabolite transporter (DMT)-like permease
MNMDGRLRWKLPIGLFAAIAFDTLLQLTWKTAVLETPAGLPPLATLAAVFTSPLIVAVIAIMALQFFNWLMVLGQADAKPVASLSYASVPALSAVIFNEAVDFLEIGGVVCVIVGVCFISQSNPLTEPKKS